MSIHVFLDWAHCDIGTGDGNRNLYQCGTGTGTGTGGAGGAGTTVTDRTNPTPDSPLRKLHCILVCPGRLRNDPERWLQPISPYVKQPEPGDFRHLEAKKTGYLENPVFLTVSECRIPLMLAAEFFTYLYKYQYGI